MIMVYDGYISYTFITPMMVYLRDGWETRFGAPTGSPLDREYLLGIWEPQATYCSSLDPWIAIMMNHALQ